MSTTPSPLYPPDPNAPQPVQPKSGFWGVLKNSVLPAISQAGNALGTLYGSPAVRQGTQALHEQGIQQQELNRQRAYDVPGLAEAQGRAQMVPYEIQKAAAEAESARKAANIAAPDWDTEIARQRQMSTAPLAGMLDLVKQYIGGQSSQPNTPPAGSPADASGELGTPPSSSSTPPAPIVDASSGRSSMIPTPEEILGAQLGHLTGTPITDKEQTQNPDGSWSFKRRTPYMGTVVGEEPAAGPPTRFMASKLLMPYYQAAGIDPGKATPEQTTAVLNAYNTNESAKSGIKFDKDINGNLVQIPYQNTTTTRTHSVVPTNESQTTPGTASAPTKPANRPIRPSASAGAATPVNGPDGQPLHGPLSMGGKNTLYNIDSTMSLIGDPKDPNSLTAQLHARQQQGSLWNAAKQRAAWEEYSKAGVLPTNIDPQMAKLLPLVAQVQILGGLPYLKGIRNQQYIQQIQTHLPDPTKDSPELMVSKLDNLSQTLPLLKQAVYESEGAAPPSASPSGPSAPAGGGAYTGGFAAWKAKQKQPK